MDHQRGNDDTTDCDQERIPDCKFDSNLLIPTVVLIDCADFSRREHINYFLNICCKPLKQFIFYKMMQWMGAFSQTTVSRFVLETQSEQRK